MSTLKNHSTARNTIEPPQVKIIDGHAVKFSTIVVADLRIGDVEDPDIYLGGAAYEWLQTEVGQWCQENSVEPLTYHQRIDYTNWGYTYAITARLSEQNITYFYLKFPQKSL